ncbi:restriction endonuclease subunit S [Pseudoalteromonas carrageenovora]|uniref:restriction endonuclease subunit S n=1 Tax=Pseudoalteromonas carrageenovora TaxID=227 RepID=UPI002FD6173B
MMPDGWEKHPVGKICRSIVPGRNKPKEFSGSIPWVTTPEIKGRYIPSKVQQNYVSTETLKECGGKIVPSGAVVMAAVGELGLVAIASEEVVLNQQLHAFICSGSVHNEYLAYWLSNQKPYMETIASKTTIPYLNKTNCESIPVALPPLSEQRKIAKILSTWDKAISTTERLIDNSKQQKKALMQQLLTGKKRLLDDSGKLFESEWLDKPLTQLAWFQEGPGLRKWQFTDDGIKVINITNIVNGKLDLSKTERHITEEEMLEKYQHFLCDAGDIVVASSGNSYCKHGIINATDLPLLMNTSVIRFKPLKGCSYDFLNQFLKSNNFKQQIDVLITGGAQPNFGPVHLKKIKVKAPCFQAQKKVASVLNNADQEIKLLEQQLTDLKQEKKALMQQLLTGKRRVNVMQKDVS